jgi:uncharacterized membrane protein
MLSGTGSSIHMTSLVSVEQTWLLLAFVVVGGAFSIWMEQNVRWAARLGGPVLVLAIAMILSNLRILPMNAPVYDVVDDYFVPIAIPLLLLRANVRRILRESGSAFIAVNIAVVGTLLGAILAGFLFRGSFPRVPEVAGIMAASYIGGAVNFVAIRNTYQVEPELSNPLIVADNFIMAVFFAVLVMLAANRWLLRRFPHPHSVEVGRVEDHALIAQHWRRKEIALVDIAQAMAFAVAAAGIGVSLAQAIRPSIESPILRSMIGNSYVWITGLTVLGTTLLHRWTEKIEGGNEVGMFLLYLFFFVLGVRADLVEVVRNVPILFVFCTVIAVTNLLVALGVGWIFRLNLEELLLSVNATLGGPPTAAAMAVARGWSNLVLPALLIGLWGYMIGTPLGILTTEFLRWML